MKRQHMDESDAQLIDLPLDVIMIVMIENQWQSLWPLGCTASQWLRIVTLPRIVKSLLQFYVNEKLPHWLFKALPAKFLGDPPDFTWHAYVDGRQMPTGFYFYTGGDVAKRLYHKEWESDIDIWCRAVPGEACDIDVGEAKAGAAHDFVVTTGPLEECLERFDISLVQQGFLYDGVTAVLYMTPLAVYSYREKKLLIRIDPLILNYNEYEIEKFRVIRGLICQWVETHRRRHHHKKAFGDKASPETLRYLTQVYPKNQFFENCELCMATLMERRDNFLLVQEDDVISYLCEENQSEMMRAIVRWNKRVMKYRNRFAEFEQIYLPHGVM